MLLLTQLLEKLFAFKVCQMSYKFFKSQLERHDDRMIFEGLEWRDVLSGELNIAMFLWSWNLKST